MSNDRAYRNAKSNLPLVALLILFIAVTIAAYAITGPAWDVIVHYLNSRSYINNLFIARTFGSYNINGWEIQKDTFYIEPTREIMPSVFLVPLGLVFHNPIAPYLVILCFVFEISVWFFGKSLKLDKFITYSLLLSPFFIYFSLIVNTTEILSVSFLLITLGLMYKKSPSAGVSLAMACLSKDPNLVFVPLLLLLGEKKRIATSYVMFAIAISPLLLFNYYFYGNPFYNYIADFSFNLSSSTAFSVPYVPILIGISIPAVFIAIVLVLSFKRNSYLDGIWMYVFRERSFTRVLACFTFLSVIAYLIISQNTDYLGKIRFAYLICLPASVLALLLLQGQVSRLKQLRTYALVMSALIMIASLASVYYIGGTGAGVTNANSNSSVFSGSIHELASLGYRNCRVTSNAWVYLLYLNESAYSPLFLNSTVASEYPIVVFNDAGVAPSLLWNINDSRLEFSGAHFSIYYPRNVTCVSSNN